MMEDEKEPELTYDEIQKKFKSQLAKLKTHLVRGCAYTFHNGYGWCYSNVAPVTDDIRKVTCGYCKTKLINELWFKDWAELTDQELDLLKVLRRQRDERKARGEAELG